MEAEVVVEMETEVRAELVFEVKEFFLVLVVYQVVVGLAVVILEMDWLVCLEVAILGATAESVVEVQA